MKEVFDPIKTITEIGRIPDVNEFGKAEEARSSPREKDRSHTIHSLIPSEIQSHTSPGKKLTPREVLEPFFPTPSSSMWTSSHEANDPSEDRNASLVNVILRPPDSVHNDCNSQKDRDRAYIRLSLWSVFDGHGGGTVASYASKVLLPHIAQNISNVLNCEIESKGEFKVNGVTQDTKDLDWEELLRSFEMLRQRPLWSNSLRHQMRRSYSLSDSDEEDIIDSIRKANPNSIYYTAPESYDLDDDDSFDDSDNEHDNITESQNEDTEDYSDNESDVDFQSTPPIIPEATTVDTDVEENSKIFSRRKKNTSSQKKVGTHSASEAAAVTKAISKSFLAIDQGWINSIDSSRTQTSCEGGGMWNVGACALVVGAIQRVEVQTRDPVPFSGSDTAENKTVKNESDDREEASHSEDRGLDKAEEMRENNRLKSFDAMLYMAHCGDCRSVLGTTVDPNNDSDDQCSSESENEESEDECSESSFDDDSVNSSESSDFESSDEENDEPIENISHMYMTFARRPAKRTCFGTIPLQRSSHDSMVRRTRNRSARERSSSISSYRENTRLTALPQNMRSVDLTVDHSAYNPTEIKLVKERSKYAPRAIAPASCGGIQRVAGSLAVTRALGDAYLKTPKLSFYPYKRHAPYISALPQVSRRILAKDEESGELCDRILILASDGVWERASGRDVINWIQSFFKTKVDEDDHQQAIHPSSLTGKRKRSSKKKQKTVADYVVRRVLNKVRRARKMSSLRALMELPKGRSRRSKHDDISASIVDLSAFVS